MVFPPAHWITGLAQQLLMPLRCDRPIFICRQAQYIYYKSATLNGVALKEPHNIQFIPLVDEKPDPVVFNAPAPAATATSSLFQTYGIPTYSVPDDGS